MKALPTILLVSVCSVALFCATEGLARPLEIVFADMEGGAGILIVTPDGESVLIDCGSRCPDERDARRIAAVAKALGLEAIDPTVAVMLNGRRKGAHPEVVAALKSATNLKAVYQLHKNAVHPDVNPPDNFIANAEPDTAGTPIRVTCDVASQRFAVRCGFDGEPMWYPIRLDKLAPERE